MPGFENEHCTNRRMKKNTWQRPVRSNLKTNARTALNLAEDAVSGLEFQIQSALQPKQVCSKKSSDFLHLTITERDSDKERLPEHSDGSR